MTRTTELEAIREEAAEYVLGKMDRATEERFQQRIQAGCGLCTAEVRKCEASLEQALKPIETKAPEGLRARILGALPAQQLSVGRGEVNPVWSATGLAGVTELVLHRSEEGGCTKMVRLLPGSLYPKHDHDSAEHCYVLEGDFVYEGDTVRAGAFLSAIAGSSHNEMKSEGGCLLLLVTF